VKLDKTSARRNRGDTPERRRNVPSESGRGARPKKVLRKRGIAAQHETRMDLLEIGPEDDELAQAEKKSGWETWPGEGENLFLKISLRRGRNKGGRHFKDWNYHRGTYHHK